MTDWTPDGSARGDQETVLLVDAEIIVRMMLAEYLRECGYRVIEAATADEAKFVLEHGDFRVDVVLVDIAAAGSSDGFAFAGWARKHKAGLPLILVGTADHASNAAGDLCEEGPMFRKPYDHQLLLQRIRQLLAERSRNSG
ncbi:MAG: response regulator [Rhodomicrobiaceae bacterium]